MAGNEHRGPSEVRFPDTLWNAVGHLAVDAGVSRSEIVRRAVRVYVQLHERAAREKVSARELLGRLVD